MASQEPESELVTKAIAGDRVAIQQLLMTHTAAVSRFAANRLPASVRDVIDPEDIVQQMGGSPYQWTTCVRWIGSTCRYRLDARSDRDARSRHRPMIPAASKIEDEGSGTAFTAARGPCS